MNGQTSDLDRILAKISPKTQPLPRSETDRSSVSSQVTPATTVSALALNKATNPYSQEDRTVELLRLRQELLAANSKIALQEQELAQTRVIKHTLDQALGPSSEADFGSREITEQTISHLQNAFNASSSAFSHFQDAWSAQDDSQSDVSDPLSTGAYNRSRALWAQNEAATDREYGDSLSGTSSSTSQEPNRFWGVSNVYPPFPGPPSLQSQRPHSGSSASPCGFYSRPIGEQMLCPSGPITGARRCITQNSRGGSLFPIQSTPWGEFASGSSSEHTVKSPASPKRPPSAFQQIGLYSVPSYPPRPIGSPLSPTATEFTGTNTNETTWTNSVSNNHGHLV